MSISPHPAPPRLEPPEAVRRADAEDPLARFRTRFSLPDGVIYLDGNSLGALPAATPSRLTQAVEREWGQDIITSWNRHDWIGAPIRVGEKIAPLIGAAPGQVMVADTTSVNLFKLLAAAMTRQDGRGAILSEAGNFPTDLYVADGVGRLAPGRRVKVVPTENVLDAIDEDTAVVMLTHVHYKSARRFDMAEATAAAHARGALMLWDLSHSAGAVELNLDACGADLAVGCGYKYLNGGPGAPAFLYVAERLQDELRSPLSGWMGHARPFDFVDGYEPGEGLARFACGTPQILGLTALETGVDLVAEAGMAALAAKSAALCALLISEVESACAGHGLVLASPREAARRGSHVSFAHPQAYAVCQALIARGVIGDFRAPDILRFGLTPLYTSFTEVWIAARTLAEVLETRAWDRPEHHARARVT